MSFSEDKTNPDNAPQVAPAPAPPPQVAAGMSNQNSQGGFNPTGSKLAMELFVGVAVVLALGAAIIFAGGAIASWATPMIPISVDQTIGEASSKQMAATMKTCSNPATQKYVEELAAPLIEVAGDVPFEFTFTVADTPEVNAFALPGGYVTVNRGLLEAAESGEEVAGVIGHEIQHALLRHGTKRILRQLGAAVIMSLIFGGSDLEGLSQVASQFTGLSYDRAQESEADEQGVALLVAAGIDPSGLSTFFERLSKDGMHPPELLSTHPDPGTRSALIAEAAKGGVFKKLPAPSTAPCHLEKSPSAKDEPEQPPVEKAATP